MEITTLASEIEILSGGTPKTSVDASGEDSIPWVSVADNVPGPYIINTDKTITEAAIKNSATKILPKETIIITARGTVENLLRYLCQWL